MALRRAGMDATVYEAYPIGATAPADRSPSPQRHGGAGNRRCGRRGAGGRAAQHALGDDARQSHAPGAAGPVRCRTAARGVDAHPVGDVRRERARR
ncbi:hypothetical protein [Microbispora bryophytorum]|uniref:hypothetical protein n=1 Tax=Microbispora bryophytorum TaxID=1460882 RepID=UPI0033DC1DF6